MMRIVFCGTPEFAVPTLRALALYPDAGVQVPRRRRGKLSTSSKLGEEFELAAVITQPDRPKGRGLKLSAPPVKVAAQELGLRVEQPEAMRGEEGRRLLEELAPEAVVIVGYGQIIPAELLTLPRYGWINLHASLLPKYRGAAPVNWALIRGETRTGVTTMQLDAGLDTGPIFLQREEAIREEDTAVSLAGRLAELGAALMVETLRGIAAGTLRPRPQDPTQATKAPLLKKEHGRIDWRLAPREIYNRVRGLVPWPGTYTSFRGQLCHLWWVRPVERGPLPGQAPPGTLVVAGGELYAVCGPTGSGWLRVEELQLAGRKRLRARDFINGLHVKSGEKFETAPT